MSAAKEEFERLLVAEDSGQCERSIPLVVRIRVAHVRALDQTFDEEEVVLCASSRELEHSNAWAAETGL